MGRVYRPLLGANFDGYRQYYPQFGSLATGRNASLREESGFWIGQFTRTIDVGIAVSGSMI